MQKTLERKIITFDMLQDSESTISDIVRTDYRTADVFRKYGINFCCSGQVTLPAACKLRNLDYNSIINELEMASRNINLPNSLQFGEWKIDFLVDYILNVHHAYLYQVLPTLELQLTSLTEGHKKKNPELIKIQGIFVELSNVLRTHNRHEEEILFPYIKQIDTAYRRKESYGNLFVRTLRKPLDLLEKEHNLISGLLKKLKLYTDNFVFPNSACTNHQILYHKFREFNDDLVQHMYLEKHVLFPKAIIIEQELLQI